MYMNIYEYIYMYIDTCIHIRIDVDTKKCISMNKHYDACIYIRGHDHVDMYTGTDIHI